jgi:hypothetical protein
MARTYFIEHRGTRILFLDFASVTRKNEALAYLEEARSVVSEQPPGSLLTLTDVSGTPVDREIVSATKDLLAHNRPYVKAGAIVGVHGVLRTIYQALARLSRRSFALFDSLDEAKDWLVERAREDSPED